MDAYFCLKYTSNLFLNPSFKYLHQEKISARRLSPMETGLICEAQDTTIAPTLLRNSSYFVGSFTLVASHALSFPAEWNSKPVSFRSSNCTETLFVAKSSLKKHWNIWHQTADFYLLNWQFMPTAHSCRLGGQESNSVHCSSVRFELEWLMIVLIGAFYSYIGYQDSGR